VHGLGGSHVNWAALAPLLSPRHRVLAVDLPGFGLTRGLGRPTSIQANARLVQRFIAKVLGDDVPVVLVGNSMGGLITLIAASTDPGRLQGVVLIDPAVPPSLSSRPDPLTTTVFAAYFVPGMGKAMLTGRQRVRTHEQLAMDTLRLCCADPSRVPAPVVAAHVELARTRPRYPGQEHEFVAATRSMLRLLSRRKRFWELAAGIDCPVLLLHGDRDRLVSIAAATQVARANPGWAFEVAAGVGHVPQLEVPDWTAERMLEWLAGLAVPSAPYTPAAALPSQ
jgi:pimeloyl-ACP methyl ester carboxylesterase